MDLWRLYRRAHGPGLDGAGGLIADGRWHKLGTPVVYLGGSPAIVLLEKLAHIDPAVLPDALVLTRFEWKLPVEDLAALDDIHELEQTQARGQQFLTAKIACLLRVPSVIMKYEYNYLFSPLHPDAGKLQPVEHLEFVFDHRLLKDEKVRSP